MWAMIAVSIAMAVWTSLLVWMQVRTEKRREIEGAGVAMPGKEGSFVGEGEVEKGTAKTEVRGAEA